MNNEMIRLDEPRRANTVVSGDLLKLFAMAIMLTDHIGAFLIESDDPIYMPLRCIGRLAFPIFCFMVAEGAHYTRSMPKYMARMAVFAFISQPPFNLADRAEWNSTESLNVFFTLFFGLAAIYSLGELPEKVFGAMRLTRLSSSRAACAVAGLPLCVLCILAAGWLNTDYAEYGVAAILIFWLLRKKPAAAWLGFTALTVAFFTYLVYAPDDFGVMHYGYLTLDSIGSLINEPSARLVLYPQPQILAVLAVIPCMLYNGERGFMKGALSKYLFYAFYPVHLFCLWIIRVAFM